MADRPPNPDGPLEGTGKGAADELALERLPPGHPSSPADTPDSDADSDRPAAPENPDAGQQPPADAKPVPDAEPDSEADRRPLTDIEHNDHIAKIRDLIGKASVDGLETKKLHTTDRDNEQWSEERAVMHDAIIVAIYEQANGVPCEGKAILAGGLPGAGKTTVLEKHAGIDRSQYLTINPDDIKEEMAKRGMIPKVDGLTPMEASELAHEESSHIAKQLALRAMPDGKNVIWDITMSSEESTAKRISDLRDFGYSHVEGLFIDITLETSIRRAESRHRDDHDKYRAGDGLGGRYVAPEIIKAQADKEWGSCNRRTFENVKSRFDAWTMYENSVDGRAPLLVDSRREEDTQ